jgi:hypothetical protein
MKTLTLLTVSYALALHPVASAQPAAQAGEFDLPYASAFTSYQRFQDAQPGSWRDVNQTVNRIGGWRAYARQAQEPQELQLRQEPQAPAAPAKENTNTNAATPSPTPRHNMADPHMQHGGKQ